MEAINKQQLRKMIKIFKRANKTFQVVAEEAGIENIPNHVEDLTREEARKILKHFGMYLIQSKEKQ